MDEKFEQLLRDYATEADPQAKAEICLELCRITRDTGEFEQSRKYGTEAFELATDASFKVKVLLAIGIGYAKQGLYNDSEKQFLIALEIAQAEENTSDLSYIYQNLSNIENGRLNIKKSIGYLTKAAHYCELNGDFAQLAHVYTAMGTSYVYLENYNMAIDYSKKALKNAKTTKLKATIQYNIANIYLKMKDFNNAYDRAKRALKINQKENDIFSLISNYVLLGFICIGKGDHAEALNYANKSLDLSEKNELFGHYLYALMVKAATYMDINQMDKAKEAFEKFLELANDETADEETMMDFYESYAAYHEKIGNVTESEIYKTKHKDLKEKYQIN